MMCVPSIESARVGRSISLCATRRWTSSREVCRAIDPSASALRACAVMSRIVMSLRFDGCVCDYRVASARSCGVGVSARFCALFATWDSNDQHAQRSPPLAVSPPALSPSQSSPQMCTIHTTSTLQQPPPKYYSLQQARASSLHGSIRRAILQFVRCIGHMK
jgi:hypothetical protein